MDTTQPTGPNRLLRDAGFSMVTRVVDDSEVVMHFARARTTVRLMVRRDGSGWTADVKVPGRSTTVTTLPDLTARISSPKNVGHFGCCDDWGTGHNDETCDCRG